MNKEVRVQVICVTYNQKDYIREALDSFLMQKTNFKFEVLVGDDCSTDGTSEIVAEYAQKYPEIIKHIRREPNMGCLANFMDLCESVTAPYAAFCDGDDYWTDENKLQKQFDYMERNEDVNICAHRVHVEIDKEDSLYKYYKNLNFQTPLKAPCSKKITIREISQSLPQTSSIFARWKKINFPKWTKEGIAGDFTIVCLQLGDKNAVILNKVMSTYRKNSTGVSFHKDDIWNNFVKTRPEYFRFLLGIIDYLKQFHNSFGVDAVKERLRLETVNYINAIITMGEWEKLLEIKEKYPLVYNNIIDLLSEYKFRLHQIDKLGKKQADLLRRNSTLRIIKPILKIIYRFKKIKKQISSLIKAIHTFLAYWVFALVPKKKNLWVFSGFKKKNYMDNTKYLFEYVVKNHPEIEAVWLTKSKEVRKYLKEHKIPVHRMSSPIGIWIMARASVAFSDHFKMSDYDNRYGFNAGTKFVQLWHGVGPKSSMPVGDFLTNTNIKGVRLSSDIIIKKEDNFFIRLIKILKYPFITPFRELYEKYFMICCPGQIFIDTFAAPLKTPENSRFLVGNPRNIITYQNSNNVNNTFKILYAPTYRWHEENEYFLVNNFIENLENLSRLLSKYNGELYLRLHPHTWRNYNDKINNAISQYTNIHIDTTKDIYTELYKYSILITDYSSIAQDFLITKRPIIYFAFDIDTIEEKDQPFNRPYSEYCAGELTNNWKENICALKKIANGIDDYKDIRLNTLEKLLPSEFNNADNSERIIEELKKRLKIEVSND